MMLKNQCNLPQIRDPFGSLFSRLLQDSIDGSDSSRSTARTTPRTNIAENDTAYELSYELPGVTEQDINVQLQDKTLTVTAERKDARDQTKDTRWHRMEHRYGQYSRAICLPVDADGEGIEAVYEAGVLTVTVPKRAEAQPAKITVRKA
jgi:HSP20 family protein